jgi:hypothetical protein
MFMRRAMQCSCLKPDAERFSVVCFYIYTHMSFASVGEH